MLKSNMQAKLLLEFEAVLASKWNVSVVVTCGKIYTPPCLNSLKSLQSVLQPVGESMSETLILK